MWVKCSTVSMYLLFIRRNKLQAWHTVTQKGDHSSQHSTVVQHSWETGFGTFSLLRNDMFAVMDDAQSWLLHNEHRSQILTLYLINKCSYYMGLKGENSCTRRSGQNTSLASSSQTLQSDKRGQMTGQFCHILAMGLWQEPLHISSSVKLFDESPKRAVMKTIGYRRYGGDPRQVPFI